MLKLDETITTKYCIVYCTHSMNKLRKLEWATHLIKTLTALYCTGTRYDLITANGKTWVSIFQSGIYFILILFFDIK